MAFVQPWVLFLGARPAPERAYTSALLDKLPDRYTRLVEPAAGSFAISLLARDGGWPADRLDTSDVSLYSSVLGAATMGADLHDLGVAVDGVPLELSDDPIQAGAEILAAQLRVRTERRYERSPTRYMADLLADLTDRAEVHIAEIARGIAVLAERLRGMTYHPRDLVEHILEACGDPSTVIVANPPSYCLAPEERMLTADLRWVPAGDVRLGDRLLAFDENLSPSGRRRLREAVVTLSAPALAERVRVRLSTGETVVCSADHPWLADRYLGSTGRRSWCEAHDLTNRSVLRAFDTWEPASSYEAGWLAGMFDGEGSLSMGETVKLQFCQVLGPVNDRIAERLAVIGLSSHTTVSASGRGRPLAQTYIGGGVAEVAKALGMLRPERLLEKWNVEGRLAKVIEKVVVDRVEPIGVGPIQTISTSTGTYIGEGFLMHNTGGYEKFFDTGGRLTWHEPPFEMFDPEEGTRQLMEAVADAPALVICSQECPSGQAASPAPIYARAARAGINVYLMSNRPQEVFEYMGGPKVVPRKMADAERPDRRVLPPDHEVTPDSALSVETISAAEAEYLKQLWAHRIRPSPASMNWAMIVDGYVAGISGYEQRTLPGANGEWKWGDHVFVMYTFTPCRRPPGHRPRREPTASGGGRSVPALATNRSGVEGLLPGVPAGADGRLQGPRRRPRRPPGARRRRPGGVLRPVRPGPRCSGQGDGDALNGRGSRHTDRSGAQDGRRG